VKYLYRAEFEDGHVFQQPSDDSSKLMPGQKSSKYDFLKALEGRVLSRLTFEGQGRRFGVDNDSFVVDGIRVRPGDDVSSLGAEWVELLAGEEVHGHYFRRVKRDALTGELLETTFCVGRPGEKVFLAVK